MTESCFYDVTVTHRRLRPRRHDLRYRIFTLLLDLDALPALTRRLRLFSADRANLLSFRQSDHGDGVPGGLRAWVEAQLDAAGITDAAVGILVLCMPRVFGHAFNPLSVFFCHGDDGALRAVLYEVNNTFGQRHTYVVAVSPGPDETVLRHGTEKRFYVSPFMPMAMRYRFRLRPPEERVGVAITGSDDAGVLIHAALAGHRRPLTDRVLLGALLRMPLLGLKVLAGIHWEALLLWRKGVRLHARPAPPATPITIGS